VVAALVFACVAPRGFGDRTPFVPDDTAAWEAIECSPERTAEVYQLLYDGEASPGQALFYFRCRGPNEYKAMLKEIQRRETWWIKHHPKRERDE
jgi:hypothetical protein